MDFDDFSDFDNDNDFNSNDLNNNNHEIKKNKTKSFDFITLIISIIAGIIGYFISNLVFNAISDSLWSPLAIGIRFAVFFLILAVVIFVYSIINGNQNDGGKNLIVLIGVLVGVLLLGTLFEFIYELNFFDTNFIYRDPTSYVFIIDNSGSMSTNDPEALRYEAIEEIIEDKDDNFPYAVYSFSDSVVCQRAVAPKSDGLGKLHAVNSGNTHIRGTLDQLLEDYENGNINGLGDNPKFLLLSDGQANDIGMFQSLSSTLKGYVKNNITISTVGLGSVDDDLMQEIADETGGVYISVDDADDLEDAMENAITQTSDDKYKRTFFTYRNVAKLDFLYALMRIIFTAILGFIISMSMLFATGKDDDSSMIMITSIITSIIAGLLLELGINALHLSTSIISLIYMILVASVFINNTNINVNINRTEEYKGQRYQSQINHELEVKNKENDFNDKNIGF